MRDGVTIYFIRHGETDWNAELRYQGQRDIPMNDRGRAQARHNGEVLRAFLPALAEADFVASPLERARETMRIVRGTLGLPVDDFRIEERLKELNYGHWEGVLASDLPTVDPEGLAARHKDPFGWRPRGGESFAELTARIAPWLDAVDRPTVVTSHGGVGRALHRHILGLPQAAVTQLEMPQDKVLVLKPGSVSWL